MNFNKSAFLKLRSERLAYVDSLRQNKGFEAGTRRLLTQLYPDNAHFIYELLQNAEDAKASHAKFILNTDSLVFEHDGIRLFSAEDVESITGLAVSTKADSPIEIGKFGVGFKAVYAYTQTPEIHSGKYHFRIHDLFVPELIEFAHSENHAFKTKFVFPFDHPKKNSEQAKAEIDRALQALSDVTLLFLSNINKISYSLPNKSEGQLERYVPTDFQQSSSKGEHIHISVLSPVNNRRDSHWLRYQSTVTIDDEDVRKSCTVALAYGLGQAESQSKKSKWEIIPLNPGRVSIYFPAEKETSNLRFHLHAPFASTVARDSVRDTTGNKQLLDALARLAAESMEDIRDRELLSMSFLEILPIQDDNISSFYMPVLEQIITAFKHQDYVPTRYASHRAGRELFRGPSDIVNLINDEDLGFLTNRKREIVAWCANAHQINNRADKFLDSLAIERWGWHELCDTLNRGAYQFCGEDDLIFRSQLSTWLSRKEDAWLCRFYAVLYEATNRHFKYLDVADLALVRIEDDDSFRMVKPEEAFFPNNENIALPDDVRLVNPRTYQSGKSENVRKGARQFLESVGVKVFDEEADLCRVIETYTGTSFPSASVHLKHINRFVKFVKARPDRCSIFSHRAVLKGQNVEGEVQWRPATKLYLDAPFEDTGLAGTVTVGHRMALWTGYLKIAEKKAFVEFVRALGIYSAIQVEQTSVRSNPARNYLLEDWHKYRVRRTQTEIDIDWTIHQIEALVKKPTLKGSRLIWTTLIQAKNTVKNARFRPNSAYPVRQSDSQLVHWLKNEAWIPDSQGVFHFPKDISRNELPPDFIYDDRNGLLTAIGFEVAIQKKNEEYQRRDNVAKEFGFDGLNTATDIAHALKVSGLDSKAAAEILMQHATRPEQPEEEVRDPVRRRQGLLQHRENAPTKESVLRERSIQKDIGGIVAQAKAYLRGKYRNHSGQMVCQACKNEMPFKLKSGEYYFEAVQAIRSLPQNFYENRLALCPTCAAKYQFARLEDDIQLRDEIQKIDVNTAGASVELEVTLANVTCTIRFVGTHFFDLKAIIECGNDEVGQ